MTPWQNRLGRLFLCTALWALTALIWAQAAPYSGRELPFTAGSRVQPFDDALPVDHADQGLFGNLVWQTEEGVSLPKAQLLINGQTAGDFAQGRLLVRVYPGDVLTLDATAYSRDLAFYLTEYSSNIDSSSLANRVQLRQEARDVGTVRFK